MFELITWVPGTIRIVIADRINLIFFPIRTLPGVSVVKYILSLKIRSLVWLRVFKLYQPV